MTIDEAKAVPLHSDEFDAAVEAASDACEAFGPGANREECGKVLTLLLQRSEDDINRKLYAR